MNETNGIDNMGHSDSNILARIDERTKAQSISLANHTQALDAHVKEDATNRVEDRLESAARIDKVIDFVSKRFDKMDERFDKIDAKLEPLQNESNQRKGAVGMSKIFSAVAYSCMALLAGYYGGGSHK